MKKAPGNTKLILKNKKAFYLYEISSRFEAGIELHGTEVKSLRQGKVSMAESYCKIEKDKELLIINLNISTYENGGYTNHTPLRKRRLLMHRREILKLRTKLQQRGFTLIPLSLYFKRGWVKIELGLGKGKRKFDKRDVLKRKEAKRELKNY